MDKSQKNLLITIVGVVGLTVVIAFLVKCTIFVCNEIEESTIQETVVEKNIDFENWTMKEWYQNIPDEYKIDAILQKENVDPELFEYSEIVDEKNYYYHVTGKYNRETGDGPYLSKASVALTIFIADDGMRTVAISREACVFGCVTSIDDLVFLQFENNSWKNIANTVPKYQDLIVQFFKDTGEGCDPGGSTSVVLPRYGTTIDFDWGCDFGRGERQLIGQLKWNPKTGTFILNKKY